MFCFLQVFQLLLQLLFLGVLLFQDISKVMGFYFLSNLRLKLFLQPVDLIP